jgi:hypothetical protein
MMQSSPLTFFWVSSRRVSLFEKKVVVWMEIELTTATDGLSLLLSHTVRKGLTMSSGVAERFHPAVQRHFGEFFLSVLQESSTTNEI